MARIALVVVALLLGTGVARADGPFGPFRFPAGKEGKAELRTISGLPVLLLQGTPEEMGAGAGALALKPGKKVLAYPRDLLGALKVDRTWAVFAVAGRGMFRRFPAAYQRELEAMIKASGADREAVIVGNTIFDLKKFLACTAVGLGPERTTTKGPLLARNLDYPSLGYIHEYSLVTVYRPTGKRAFAAVGFPGIVGVLSGMNDAGLALAVLEVFDVKGGEVHFDPTGVPYALCLRSLLEECRTIDEAQKALEGMKRTCTINVALADRTGVAMLEVTPRRVVRRAPEKGVCVAANHYCAPSLRPERPINIDRSFERFAHMEELRNLPGRYDRVEVQKRLAAVNLGAHTLQSMVFDPVALTLHLSIGRLPATRGPYRALDLRPLFRMD